MLSFTDTFEPALWWSTPGEIVSSQVLVTWLLSCHSYPQWTLRRRLCVRVSHRFGLLLRPPSDMHCQLAPNLPLHNFIFCKTCFQPKKTQYFLVFLLVLTVPSQKLNWTLIIEWSGPPPKWYLWMISLISGLLTCSLGLQCFQASSSGVPEKRRVRKINIEGYLSDSW